jgi:hypothetical protein
MPFDNNSEQKAGGGANWGRKSGRERAPARAARSKILVRQDVFGSLQVPYNEYLVEISGSLACSRDYLYWFKLAVLGNI